MGCCPSRHSEESTDGEREHFISQNEAEAHESVREQRGRVDNFNIEIENLKEKLKQAQEKSDKKQRKCDDQEETITQLEKQVQELKTENQRLLTRFSQLSSVKLADGNPNIADLSDPNRPEKLAEQFSELYDNQWTDGFQVLCELPHFSAEGAIEVLLKIILTVYDLCREEVEYQNKKLRKAITLFTRVEVIDQADESAIQESLHNLRSFRAKKYDVTVDVLKKKIGDSLQSMFGYDVYIACQDYIAECIKVCWLMSVKSPSMYISARTEETFNQDLYTSYTQSGPNLAYVVWPALFQYENGPKLKKGVAQGTN